MPKPVSLLLKITGASGLEDQEIIVSASNDPEKKPETFRELVRLPAGSPQNADGEITHTASLDAELPTWIGLAVHSKFHKETTGFLSFAFMPQAPGASTLSLSVQRLPSAT